MNKEQYKTISALYYRVCDMRYMQAQKASNQDLQRAGGNVAALMRTGLNEGIPVKILNAICCIDDYRIYFSCHVETALKQLYGIEI